MSGLAPQSQQQQVGILIVFAVLITSIPQFPLGNYLLYPFTILTTWFHEMGHGLTALMLGYDFYRLVILPDGSGVAETYGEPSIIAQALISAGGPLAPTAIGSALILASARQKSWRPALYVLAGIIALSVLIWVRSTVGLVVLPLVAAALVGIALRGSSMAIRLTLQFLGVLGALSMFRDWDYLFSESALVGGQVMYSDTGAIEQALYLPHWIWAILIIVASAAMILASLKYALSHDGGVRTRRW